MATEHPRVLLTLLFAGVLMGAVDLSLIGPALPAIQVEFGMDDRQLSMLFNAYVLFQMVGTPLLAKMSDRLGPRTVYISSIACFAVGSLVLVTAGDMNGLLAGRAIQGFGAGGIFPAAAAVIGAELSLEERGPALGILGAVYGVAFLIGPILGGIFLRYSWQWLFIINLPVAALLIVGAMRMLPAASQHEPQPLDLKGAVALSVLLTTLVLALNNLDTQAVMASLTSWPVGPSLVLMAVLIPVFWRLERRALDPIIRPELLHSRQTSKACALSCGIGALQSGGVFYPALAVAALGVSTSDAAWLMLPGVVAATICSPIAGRLINTLGTRTVISFSMGLVIISIAIYAFADLTVTLFIVAGVISGTGNAGLLGAPLRYIVLNEAAPQDRTASQGLLSVFGSTGRLIGAAIVGSVAASFGGGATGYQAAFVGMVLLGCALAVVAITLKSRSAELASRSAATEAASA